MDDPAIERRIVRDVELVEAGRDIAIRLGIDQTLDRTGVELATGKRSS
ncbi:MAG: hypothetical protein JF603_14595 [Acidobacteria bacterium]|nr:hypothetical protein [Acidobacteriota bacterium]